MAKDVMVFTSVSGQQFMGKLESVVDGIYEFKDLVQLVFNPMSNGLIFKLVSYYSEGSNTSISMDTMAILPNKAHPSMKKTYKHYIKILKEDKEKYLQMFTDSILKKEPDSKDYETFLKTVEFDDDEKPN